MKLKYPVKFPCLSKFQTFILLWAIFSSIVFIPEIKQYLGHQSWGRFVFPGMDDIVHVLGYTFTVSHLVALHALIAFSLLVMMIAQITFAAISLINISFHRFLGRFIVMILLPIFILFATLSILFALKTPFNRLGFLSLLVLFLLSQIMAIVYIKKGRILLHKDYMIVSCVLLSAASVYRLSLAALFFIGDRDFVNNAPVDGAILITAMILFSCIIMSGASVGRLKQHLIIPVIGILLLIGFMIMVPWNFYGAPYISRIFG